MEIEMSMFSFVVVACYAVGTILWLWMIVDCAIKEPSEGVDKVFWTLLIVMGYVIGALIYLFVRRPKRIEQLGR